MASVAESFLHEELTPREEASVLGSLHSEFPGALSDFEQDVVPGGLDPFEVGNGEEPRSETEPGGISLFATLIERLLSRFEFDAHDIRVTIVHPDNVSVTLTLPEIKYSANTKQSEAMPSTPECVIGVTRSLTTSGIMLQMKDLESGATQFPPVATSIPSSPFANADIPDRVYQTESPRSSSSSLDEETTIAMSQSLATLPPRPASPYSAASSMYQSALSAVNEADEHFPEPTFSEPTIFPPSQFHDNRSTPEETVFSSGSTPITIQIVTAPPSSQSEELALDRGDKMTFSMHTGLLSCALRPWHIRGLLRFSSQLLSKLPQSQPRPSSAGVSPVVGGLSGFDVETSLNLRGLVLLLLPSHSGATSEDLQQFFLHPLVPPALPSGYLRLHVEGIFTSLVLPSQPSPVPKQTIQAGTGLSEHSKITGVVSIHNLNIFGFRPCSDGIPAFPVLFTDPHLPNQYPPQHLHPSESDGNLNESLPEFNILDWTNPDHQKKGAARLSYWRCKPKARQQSRQSGLQSTSPPISNQPGRPSSFDHDEHVLSVEFQKVGKHKGSSHLLVEGRVLPLHLLVDLDTAIGDDAVMQFLEEATQGLAVPGEMTSSNTDPDRTFLDETPPAAPRPHRISDEEKERRRLERMVLEDLDLGYDYGGAPDETDHRRLRKKVRFFLSFMCCSHSEILTVMAASG
jgi:autophagy-related protein 2